MNTPNEASISFFDCGEHTIKVIASFTSGKEYVYVDDQLVSEKRSFRYKSEHTSRAYLYCYYLIANEFWLSTLNILVVNDSLG